MIPDGPYSESELLRLLDDDILSTDTEDYYASQGTADSIRRPGPSHYANTIKAQREESYKLYYMLSPEPRMSSDEQEVIGSSFISSEVYDTVESIKTILMETFTRNPDAVMLKPEGEPDITEMDAWVDYVLNRADCNRDWLLTTFHEALLAKAGPVRVALKRTRTDKRVDETVPQEMLPMLEANPDIELLAVEPVGDGIAISANISIQSIELVIEPIPPENFMLRGASTRDWDYIGHRAMPTVQDLIEMGLDEDDIKRLPDTYEHQHLVGGRYARHVQDNTVPFRSSWRRNEVDPRLHTKAVHHSFRRIDIDGDGEVETIYCLHGYDSGVLLDFQIVEDHWYEVCVPLPLAHKLYGLSISDVLLQVQFANTHLWRQILNNVLTSNEGRRTEVGIGAFADQDEGLRAAEVLGGMVEVMQPGASYYTEPHIPLPQETMPAMQALAAEKESRSGLSRLAMGMESKAISHQNAEGMVAALADMGQQRIAQMARTIAHNFFVPVINRVIALTRDNAGLFEGRVIKIDGQFRPIHPGQWREDLDMEVNAALTPDEQARQAQDWMALDTYLKQHAAEYYLPPNQAFVLSQALRYLGKPVDKILSPPGSPAYQEAQAMQAQAAQEEKGKAEAQLVSQLEVMRAQAQKLRVDADMKGFAEISRVEQQDEKQELEEEKFDWQQIVDTWERDLEEQQQRGVDL